MEEFYRMLAGLSVEFQYGDSGNPMFKNPRPHLICLEFGLILDSGLEFKPMERQNYG
jgi:hypothetical protein